MSQALPEKNFMEAFSILYRQHHRPLVAYGHQLINNEQQAEEIATDVFIKLLRKKNDFSDSKDIKLFLYVTVRNACYDYLRYGQPAETTHQEIIDFVTDPEEGRDKHEDLFRAQILQAIYHEIEHLPEQCKQVFKYLFFNGMSTDQITAEMKISPKTVREQKNRALTLLRLSLLKTAAIPS
jgi:RNA polymerase sigma-70 factor (family 1)